MLTVCPRCNGKGRVWTRTGQRQCPQCGGGGDKKGMARVNAINAAAYCWRVFTTGQTDRDNLALAVSGAYREGVSLAELAEKAGAPERMLKPFYDELEDKDQPQQRIMVSTVDLDRKALREPCPTCGAVAGKLCETRSGAYTRRAHSKRRTLGTFVK